MADQTSRDIVVRKEDDQLILEKSWRSPATLFFIPFTLIWNVIVLTTTAGLGLSALMFPHVWLGFGLAYWTLAMIFNKTKITASKDGPLRIRSGPIPTFGNKDLNPEEIDQIYVRKHITKGKNGVAVSYEIMARLPNGRNTKLIGAGTIVEPYDAKFIEQQLEEYLEIPDFRVPGEFDGGHKPLPEQTIRREQPKMLDAIDIRLKDMKKGFVVDFDQASWKVVYEMQYDWSNGSTERFFQLDNGKEDLLLYLKKDFGLLKPFLERRIVDLPVLSTTREAFSNLPPKVEHEGKIFYRESTLLGKAFSGRTAKGIEVQQAFYMTEAHDFSLRILLEDGISSKVFLGEEREESSFYQILPKG